MGDPLPQSIPSDHRENRGPSRPNPPSCLFGGSPVFKGKFPRVRGFRGVPVFGCFSVGRGTCDHGLCWERASACFRLPAIWVGGGDIRAWVGLRCKVKLPRRGSSAAARGRRRKRAAGWRHLRCVHSSASLWRRGRRKGRKDDRSGLEPAGMCEYVCVGVCGCLSVRPSGTPVPAYPCSFIRQSDWHHLASQLITKMDRKQVLSPNCSGILGSPLAAFRGGFLDKR